MLAIALCLTLGSPEQGFESSLAVLEHAVESVGEDDAPTTAAIEAALAEVAKSPEKLGDLDRQLLRQVRFTLVWSHLAAGDRARAIEAMDETIRSTGTSPIEKSWNFGPDVPKLFKERVEALQNEGTGKIEVKCTSCRVFVNEQEILGGSELHEASPLFLGEYRVIVVFDGQDSQRREIEVDSPADVETWGPMPAVAIVEEPGPPIQKPKKESRKSLRDSRKSAPIESTAAGSTPADTSGGQPTTRRKRILPLPAEISGIVVGAGLLIAGGILLGFDEKCPGGGDIMSLEECPEIYLNKPQGYTLTVLGAAAMLTGGVLLTVDEVRVGRQQGTQATLTWTFRF